MSKQIRPLRPATLLALVLGLAPAVPLAAQDVAQRFDQQSTVVQEDLESVISAQDRVRTAMRQLDGSAAALREGMGDPETPVPELRQLDGKMMAALEAFARTMYDAAAERDKLYSSMDRLARLGEELGHAEATAVAEGDVSGRWQVRVDGQDIYGVLELHRNGGRVTGNYKLSNGATGSVEGMVTGNTLELQRFDRARGRDAQLTATLEPGATTMTGVWQPFDLGSGGQSLLGWTARRLAPGQAPVAP